MATGCLYVLLNLVYYIFNIGDNTNLARTQIQGVLACFTPFFVAYYYSYKGKFLESTFSFLIPVLLVVYILSFYRMEVIMSQQLNIESNIVNNVAYSFTRITPLLFYFNAKVIIATFILLIINLFVIIGAKRGAAISALLGDLGYLVFVLKNLGKARRFKKIIIIAALVGFVYGLTYLLQSYTFLLSRFIEDGASNRDEIYMSIWDWWTATNVNVIDFLFGGGIVYSANLTGGMLAHSDWLEVISNFGLTGLIIYAVFIGALIYSILRFKANKDKLAALVVIAMWLATSLTSTWYNTADNFASMMLIGFLLGKYNIQNRSTILNLNKFTN